MNVINDPLEVIRLTVRVVFWFYWGLAAGVVWLVRLCVAHRLTRNGEMVCPTCHATIPLLGHWQCSCGYSTYGFYFSHCLNCGDSPSYVTCGRCLASTMNPALIGSWLSSLPRRRR